VETVPMLLVGLLAASVAESGEQALVDTVGLARRAIQIPLTAEESRSAEFGISVHWQFRPAVKEIRSYFDFCWSMSEPSYRRVRSWLDG